ncbi:MAG TPA: LLM class flavin-dependent oxidoreductase [Nitrososphaerales archaeon]|nr:LLM class flavin-dependent oxidoreductase [Nitrososphaerales archaeon]
MRRLGLSLGYSPQLTVRDMADWVVEAERRGFEIAFFSETVLTMRDAITALSAFAMRTKTIQLGSTQILRTRTPLVIAQTFTSLAELSEGRVTLCVGAFTESHARKHGLPLEDPAKVLREHTALIREYWKSSTVDFQGETIKVKGEGLSILPQYSIPILIAATSRTGLRIAADVGDGVLINATTSPGYARNALAVIRERGTETARGLSGFKVSGLVVSAVDDGTKEPENALRWELASKFGPLQVDFAVRPRLRVGEEVVTEDLIRRMADSYRIGGKEKLARDIPLQVVKSLTAFGSPRDVSERVEEYREAGIDLPIVRPAGAALMKPVMDALT